MAKRDGERKQDGGHGPPRKRGQRGGAPSTGTGDGAAGRKDLSAGTGEGAAGRKDLSAGTGEGAAGRKDLSAGTGGRDDARGLPAPLVTLPDDDPAMPEFVWVMLLSLLLPAWSDDASIRRPLFGATRDWSMLLVLLFPPWVIEAVATRGSVPPAGLGSLGTDCVMFAVLRSPIWLT